MAKQQSRGVTRKYSSDELEYKVDSAKERSRLRTIFDDLIDVGGKGMVLSAAEMNFVYNGIKFFNDRIENYRFLNDSRFKDNYLTYCFDITGGSEYYKMKRRSYKVDNAEKEADLTYLISEAEAWEQRIGPAMHGEPLLQNVATETKIDKKKLDKSLNIKNVPFLSGTNFYQYKLWGI